MPTTSSVMVAIPAAPERQETILHESFAPLVRDWRAAPPLEALYFERSSKPDWRLLFRVDGAEDWLERDVRPRLALLPGVGAGSFDSAPFDTDTKWVGGPREREYLRRIFFADTIAFFDWTHGERSGALEISRAEHSLLLVENLLDLFGLGAEDRLEFYHRGYQWAVDNGRWDGEVFAALDEMYASQKEALRAALDGRGAPGAKDDSGASRIARAFLDRARPGIEAIRAACAAGELDKDLLSMAEFVAHAHSNRFGIFATQEASLRYLVRRSRLEGAR